MFILKFEHRLSSLGAEALCEGKSDCTLKVAEMQEENVL